MKRNTMGRTLITLFLIAGLVAMIGCAAADQTFTGTV